jgi:hypothetical protein
MNSAYADNCKFCGCEIKWAPDDGTDYKEPPNFSEEESKFKDSAANEGESECYSEKADLDNIYNQLEEIKERMAKGVNLFDVTMPFSKMVVLIIKLTFASIPAAMIVSLIPFLFWLIFGRLIFQGMMRGYGMH